MGCAQTKPQVSEPVQTFVICSVPNCDLPACTNSEVCTNHDKRGRTKVWK